MFWQQSWFKPYYRKLSVTVTVMLMLSVLGACTNNPRDMEPTDGGRTLQDNEFLMDERTVHSEPGFDLMKADINEEGQAYVIVLVAMGVTKTLYVGEPYDFSGEGVLTLLRVEIADPPPDPDADGGGNHAVFRYEKAS